MTYMIGFFIIMTDMIKRRSYFKQEMLSHHDRLLLDKEQVCKLCEKETMDSTISFKESDKISYEKYKSVSRDCIEDHRCEGVIKRLVVCGDDDICPMCTLHTFNGNRPTYEGTTLIECLPLWHQRHRCETYCLYCFLNKKELVFHKMNQCSEYDEKNLQKLQNKDVEYDSD